MEKRNQDYHGTQENLKPKHATRTVLLDKDGKVAIIKFRAAVVGEKAAPIF